MESTTLERTYTLTWTLISKLRPWVECKQLSSVTWKPAKHVMGEAGRSRHLVPHVMDSDISWRSSKRPMEVFKHNDHVPLVEAKWMKFYAMSVVATVR